MAREIERRFIVDLDWPRPRSGVKIVQGYIPTAPNIAVRIRVAGSQATLTLKKLVTERTRNEFEVRIPEQEAGELLRTMCHPGLIEKTRFRVKHENLIWEVDEFHGSNEGLTIAEIELVSENQKFPVPPWVGKEITNDPRYLNANLARNPYQEWKTGS